MSACRKCKREIPTGVQYCPYCSAPVIEETFVCPKCGNENDLSANGCSSCGFKFAGSSENQSFDANDIFDTTYQEGIQQEVADKFSLHFEKRLKEEHHPNLHGAYIDRFFKSEFRQNMDYRIQQLAELVSTLKGSPAEIKKQKNKLLHHAFEELVDFFVIQYCNDLNETHFPESMLKYQGQSKDQIDMLQMIRDYLDFENEDESVFFDFLEMPAKKLKNAADSFLFPKKGDTLYFICDLSILGTCKDGFAMTSECIFWKTPLESKQRVFYKKLREIKRQEDWITINGIFFSANKSLNLKLIRLLKKLQLIYQ